MVGCTKSRALGGRMPKACAPLCLRWMKNPTTVFPADFYGGARYYSCCHCLCSRTRPLLLCFSRIFKCPTSSNECFSGSPLRHFSCCSLEVHSCGARVWMPEPSFSRRCSSPDGGGHGTRNDFAGVETFGIAFLHRSAGSGSCGLSLWCMCLRCSCLCTSV